MSHRNADELAYYSSFGNATDPQRYSFLLDGLPTTALELSSVVQGTLVHILEAWRYGLQLPVERKREVSIGTAAGLLERSQELDGRPLTEVRSPSKRVVATCHDFSILLCAMFRQQRRPARARAGFAAYLSPGRYIDHWVCQYWDGGAARWVTVDAQLDQVQRQGYGIGFDPCDVPEDRYLTGARAWQQCRAGRMDPQLFGFSRWWGMGYLRHVLLRDLLALNKMEGLPWENAGLSEVDESGVSAADRTDLDQIAALAAGNDGAFAALRSTAEQVLRTGRPPDWRPWRLDQV